MALISQLIVNGLIAGSVYALVAAGFSLIYSTVKFMHFAHGITVTIGGYVLFSLFTSLQLPFLLAATSSIVVCGLLGVALYKLLYLPLQKRNASNVVLMIASLALLIMFENVVQLIYGAQVRVIDFTVFDQTYTIFGAAITGIQIMILLVSIVLALSLYYLMTYTKLGRNMRAVADNPELASIVGVSHRRVSTYAFLIGSALAGVAGVLIGLEQNLVPNMGVLLIIKGFTGAVIGGLLSVPGAIVGAFFIGLIENISIGLLDISTGFKDAIAFGILFLFLLFKPQGIFGVDRGVKA